LKWKSDSNSYLTQIEKNIVENDFFKVAR
jgi:hypothetical protein